MSCISIAYQFNYPLNIIVLSYYVLVLTLLLQSFYTLLCWARSYFFYKPSPGKDFFFSMFTVWHGLFSLVLMFPGLRIEAPPHPQYRVSVYTLFKAENHEIQFPLLCTKPSKDKQRLVVLRLISRPAVPIKHHQFSRFIS